MTRRVVALLAAAITLTAGTASAQLSGDKIRIGILNDQSGPFSRNGGPGSTAMAKLAVEDFGGTMLGKQIEIVSADHQNKPDIAASIARQWYGVDGVDLILDGASSAAALAIHEVARGAGKPFLSSGAATTEITGKLCSPMTLQFNYDTYMLANGAAKALVNTGNDTWFLLVADYAFGHGLERDLRRFVEAAGGKVVGSVRHPVNNADFSSFILQAQTSKAKVIGLATAGLDFIAAVKQAAEFGVTTGGQKLGGILVNTSEIDGLGLEAAKGLTSTETFYWDLNENTRALSKRFGQLMNGRIPTAVQAGVYSATLHYLKAVQAAGSDDGAAVMRKMKELPVDDAYNKGVTVRADGRVMHEVYLFEVKSPQESKYPFDYYKTLAHLAGQEAFRPLSEGECPLAQSTTPVAKP